MRYWLTNKISISISAFLIGISTYNATAQTGDNDPTFNLDDKGFSYGESANSTIYATAIQNDGKIILGGSMTRYNDVSCYYLTRTNIDGSTDGTFKIKTEELNGTVRAIGLQSDGKIIIGGDFTRYKAVSTNHIARLNTDGTLDNTFNIGSGANDIISLIKVQNDGKIIIGGQFKTYNGINSKYIARLNINGLIDTTFNVGSGPGGTLSAIALQGDGKIIIGGSFYQYNGITRNNLVRLNPNGSIDTTFKMGTGPNGTVETILVNASNYIVVCGGLQSINLYNGKKVKPIFRITPAGTLDDTFDMELLAGIPLHLVLQHDGKIIVLWGFSTVTRLNQNGSIDKSYVSKQGIGNIFTSSMQSDGKIIIAGDIIFNDKIPLARIARLNTDGSRDMTFNIITGANKAVCTTTIQKNGKIIIGGKFTSFNGIVINHIARLNFDGTLDSSFNVGTGTNGDVLASVIQSDEKIIIAGAFTAYDGTAVNSLVRLLIDGTIDNSFAISNISGVSINSMTLQNDGKIIVAGQNSAGSYIARMNADGTKDLTFKPGTIDQYISATAVQNDGKILIGGNFTSYNIKKANHIARLNVNGSLDSTFIYPVFNPGANGIVRAIAIQNDGKILIGGGFTHYNEVYRKCFARLNTDGSLDQTFNLISEFNYDVYCILIQPDEKIIAVGDFNKINNIGINEIARLNTDGSIDKSFNSGSGVQGLPLTAAIQKDGNIIIGGEFTSYNSIGRNRIARIATRTVAMVKPQEICPGTCSSITAMSTGGVPPYTYVWNTGEKTSSIKPCPTKITTYTVIVTDSNGVSATTTATITFKPKPIVTVEKQEVCFKEKVLLTANGADTYKWSPPIWLNSTIGKFVVSTPLSNINYKVIGTSQLDCIDSTTIWVYPGNKLNISIEGKDTVCLGESTTLTALCSFSPVTYEWLPDGQTSQSITISPTVTNTYTLAVTESTGCTAFSQKKIFAKSCTSGIQEQTRLNISVKVIPNPFTDQAEFIIESDKLNDTYNLELYTIFGERVKSIQAISKNQFQLSRNGLPSGIYFYMLFINENRGVTGKIMVQ